MAEGKIPFKRFEIDLKNKPEWYAPKINPASKVSALFIGVHARYSPQRKVPAISYGGPDVDPATPSPESQKIAESGVLIELIADLSKEELLPKDPITRARARFFTETVTSAASGAWYGAVARGEDPAPFLKALDTLQSLLPAEGFAVGQWSIADAAVTPFFARAEVTFKNDIGKYEVGKGKALWAIVESDPKYARFRKYLEDVKGRDSFKTTFHPVRDLVMCIDLPYLQRGILIGCGFQLILGVIRQTFSLNKCSSRMWFIMCNWIFGHDLFGFSLCLSAMCVILKQSSKEIFLIFTCQSNFGINTAILQNDRQ